MPGKTTLAPEITGITIHGIWLLLPKSDAKSFAEYFISFDSYPEFKSASVESIHKFTFKFPDQLHWIDLDIDIDLGSLKNPEDFPLRFIRTPG